MFRESHPELDFRKVTYGRGANAGFVHKDFNCTTRSAFVDFVDMLARDGVISESLAFRVTL